MASTQEKKEVWLVGAFAKATGVSSDSLRYYEKEGLLRPARAENGYRYFNRRDRERMTLILNARACGFTLNDIKELLSLVDAGRRSCSDFENQVQTKLKTIDDQIKKLQDSRRKLLTAVALCSDQSHCAVVKTN